MKTWMNVLILACIVTMALPAVLGVTTRSPAGNGDDDDDAGEDEDETSTAGRAAGLAPGPMLLRLSTLEPDTLKKVLSPSLVYFTTTSRPATAKDVDGNDFRLSLDVANPRCGDPKYKYHYKKFANVNVWTGLSDVDACCLRPDIQATQDIKVMNATCCLTQGSLCAEEEVPCCKNAQCKKTESGEKRCEFNAGFWQTSKSLHMPFTGWKPAKTPMVCTDSRYMFYREASVAVVKGMPPKSGCCAMQDTTEPEHVYRACCLNSHEGCCFKNGYCRKWIPSTMVPYEMRENEFQKKLGADVLSMIQHESK